MSTLNHSANALNVIGKFYGTDTVIFVEGSTDILFWKYQFDKYGHGKVKIIKVGQDTIEAYVKLIENGKIKIIVARDTDYHEVIGSTHKHPQVLYTYGHSIENTIFCPQAIAKYIINAVHDPNYDMAQFIIKWYEDLWSSLRILIEYDIANIMFDKGIKVLGKQSAVFCRDDMLFELSATKIKDKANQLNKQFTKSEIDRARRKIHKYKKPKQYLIRGHFLDSIMFQLVRYLILRKKSKHPFSNDSMYAALIDKCLNCKNQCDEHCYYETMITSAYKEIS